MMMSNMVDGMKDDKVGLVIFAGQAFTQIPITSDYVSAKMFLETISPSMISVQGTDIAEAIRLGCKSFTQQEDVAKAIFLITDGEDNEGGAIEAAQEAAKAGIRVYILGIGIDRIILGSYIFVDNSTSAQKKLSEQVEKLAKSKIESQIYSEYDEQFQGFIILGLLFLFLDVLFLERSSHRKLFSNLLRNKEYVK